MASHGNKQAAGRLQTTLLEGLTAMLAKEQAYCAVPRVLKLMATVALEG